MNGTRNRRILVDWQKKNPSVAVTWKPGRDNSVVGYMESGKVILPHKNYPKPAVGDTTDVLLIEKDRFALAIPYDIAENEEWERLKEGK